MEVGVKKDQIKEIIAPLAEQVKASSKGIERHREIGAIIDEQPQEVRAKLRGVIESLLKKMYQIEASDIDIGGPGCDNKVWYRVHGDKSPDKSGPEFTLTETDFLLHNLIMPSQRDHLLDIRNLDFSYSIGETDSIAGSKRFRADMYFDLEHLALNMRKIDDEIRPFKGLNLHPKH